MFRRLCPTSATMMMISTICGKARNTSEILRISLSAQPPLYPTNMPSVTPMTAAPSALPSPTTMLTLPP